MTPEPAPRRLRPGDPALTQVLALTRAAFAFMDGVVDPPSSIHRMDMAALTAAAGAGELWVIGAPVRASVILTPKPDALYLGKLAVAEEARGQGLARRLVDHAAARAAALGLAAVELQVRVELTGNQRAFAAMGFAEVARTAHAGYARPTSVTMRRLV